MSDSLYKIIKAGELVNTSDSSEFDTLDTANKKKKHLKKSLIRKIQEYETRLNEAVEMNQILHDELKDVTSKWQYSLSQSEDNVTLEALRVNNTSEALVEKYSAEKEELENTITLLNSRLSIMELSLSENFSNEQKNHISQIKRIVSHEF